jgi:glutamate 5-kinase
LLDSDSAASIVLTGIAGDPALEKMAGGAASQLSKGGMLTKVLAAKVAAQTGASTIIASGKESDILIRLLAGEMIGTHLSAS